MTLPQPGSVLMPEAPLAIAGSVMRRIWDHVGIRGPEGCWVHANLSDLPATGAMVTSGPGLLPRTMSESIVQSQLGSILMSMAYSAN